MKTFISGLEKKNHKIFGSTSVSLNIKSGFKLHQKVSLMEGENTSYFVTGNKKKKNIKILISLCKQLSSFQGLVNSSKEYHVFMGKKVRVGK